MLTLPADCSLVALKPAHSSRLLPIRSVLNAHGCLRHLTVCLSEKNTSFYETQSISSGCLSRGAKGDHREHITWVGSRLSWAEKTAVTGELPRCSIRLIPGRTISVVGDRVHARRGPRRARRRVWPDRAGKQESAREGAVPEPFVEHGDVLDGVGPRKDDPSILALAAVADTRQVGDAQFLLQMLDLIRGEHFACARDMRQWASLQAMP